ncbi:hypothetical protein PYCCODRAFT_1460751 [Trametes coccinea BRFM310]|uniref:Uncharacterized protein n=1 Tax=Trametes coccinea (strain BRFM310) TaxID=1353009 RepID=A0A1Y2IFZ4_TRAC3|nr:hypothetical protein PYCCODRAFT_1460751 [Trametes coccinea BRFM310]
MMSSTVTSSNNYLLVVAQQDLQRHHRRTEHWALVVMSPGKRSVLLFQLAGNLDTFHFETMEVSDVLAIAGLCGGCRVGEIAADGLEHLTSTLATQRIILHDRMWDCQDWLYEALRTLKEEGGGPVKIDGWLTERDLRAKLREEKELWERAEDHYFERMSRENA